MAKKKHANKDINEALEYARSRGWLIEPSSGHGHAWGKMYCPYNDSDCRCGEFCITSIWSTPRSSGHHAKQIKRVIDNCTGKPRLNTTED